MPHGEERVGSAPRCPTRVSNRLAHCLFPSFETRAKAPLFRMRSGYALGLCVFFDGATHGNYQSKLTTNRLPTMNRYAPKAISSVRFDIACAALTPSGAVRRLNGITNTAPIS